MTCNTIKLVALSAIFCLVVGDVVPNAYAMNLEGDVAKFHPQVNVPSSTGAVDGDLYSYAVKLGYAYSGIPGNAYEYIGCSGILLAPNVVLTTYECVRPVFAKAATVEVLVRQEGLSSSVWNSERILVKSTTSDAAQGVGLLFLDKSPISRASQSGTGVLGFATVAATSPVSGDTLTVVAPGCTNNCAQTGTLRSKSTTVISQSTAESRLSTTTYTYTGSALPLNTLHNISEQTATLFYTGGDMCLYDWGGSALNSAGEVVGLYVGYTGTNPATGEAELGGPYIHHYNSSYYRYPLTCTSQVDVFLDVPALVPWVRTQMTLADGTLDVTGPVSKADNTLWRNVERGAWGTFTFTFALPYGDYNEIWVHLPEHMEVPIPADSNSFFDFIYGTDAGPSSVVYDEKTRALRIRFANAINSTGTSNVPFYFGEGVLPYGVTGQPFGPEVRTEMTYVRGSTIAPRRITLSLYLRAASVCSSFTWSLEARQCSLGMRCETVFTFTAEADADSRPTRCNVCNACVPYSYTQTTIRSADGRCLNSHPTRREPWLGTCNGTEAQRWTLNGLAGDRAGIIDHTGQCIDVAGSVYENPIVMMRPCSGVFGQNIGIERLGGDAVRLRVGPSRDYNGNTRCLSFYEATVVKGIVYHWPWFRVDECSAVANPALDIYAWNTTFYTEVDTIDTLLCRNGGLDFYRSSSDLESSCTCDGVTEIGNELNANCPY